jgi:cyclic pyranopterin phosphate synthase
MSTILDRVGRPLRNLRISVTDRCNLRCQYCMPEEHYVWLPRSDILDFEEICALVDCFIELGVDRVRLTGGEPLLRHDLPTLVRMLAAKPALRDLALTTNAMLLAEQAPALAAAGLHRLTVSVDTLRADRFRVLTRRDGLAQVLSGIDAARAAGFSALKLDAVVMRGTNEDELVDLIEYGRRVQAEVRFIEYMDVGGATHWSPDRVHPRQAMLADLARRYGPIEALREETSAPAARYRLPDGTVSVIASTTAPFCADCDRSRLTADGMWYLCLYAARDRSPRRSARSAPRAGRSHHRPLAGAQRSRRRERLARRDRAAWCRPASCARPHLEMHTRGG